MQSNVCCVGELLIDMFCTNVDVALKDGESFKKMAGGAPANVAATISKLGGTASFAGKVGEDSFGDFLVETLDRYNVDTTMVSRDEVLPTTIAFVSLTADGERDFQFNRGADKNLELSDLSLDKILNSKLLHFGSATALLEGESQRTYFELIERANQAGIFVSFDPNFRQDLWKGNESEFIRLSKQAISKANFVKVSHEELELITNKQVVSEGIDQLHRLGAKIVTVTMGKEGSIISNGEHEELIPSFKVDAVDATGAGDAFIGAVLYKFANEIEINPNDFTYLKEVVEFANKVGAAVCTKIGSLTALPTLNEVN
ncbi:carbohydrate kinase family protein [Aquibacillus saliphilus]|uniref:carbohydrate kinase family protein n=1 Tax=Aquibacillus saliphilus TaxID=1909422 RepID=UPI001CF07C48|nr:carbohydrate kinase [Aquibacillus saliphilus]